MTIFYLISNPKKIQTIRTPLSKIHVNRYETIQRPKGMQSSDIWSACTIAQSCIEGCMSVVLPRWMVIDMVWWSRDAKKFQAVVEGLWSVYRVKMVGKKERERKRERAIRKKREKRQGRERGDVGTREETNSTRVCMDA